jgi:hypothetical protein
MIMTTSLSQATPVSISGTPGTTVSLYDLLVQTYGADAVSKMTSVTVNEYDKSQIQGLGLNFWDPNNPVATHIQDSTGHDIGGNDTGPNGSFHYVTVNFPDFAKTQIVIGNNIMPNIFIGVPENPTWDTYTTLVVNALPPALADTHPVGYVPTANDVVAAAMNVANHFGGTTNLDDCHNIASAIAASAGATLDVVNTGNTGGPGATGAVSANEASGFWRIQESGGGPGWINQVQAGDIVRMELKDPTGSENPHTVTVVSGPDAAHPGQIQVVDNADGNHTIGAHWVAYDEPGVANNNFETTVPGSVTIYRLTTDGQYLIDQHAVTSNVTIQGDAYNDLIKVGTGSDTVNGSDGNDTAALAGNKADYSIVHNTDGSVTVTGHGATDKLVSIEHIQFNDQTVDLTAAPPAAPVVSIDNVSMAEGNNGTVIETFHVTRTGGEGAFNVNYTTADGTATVADGDYDKNASTLVFAQGEDSKTIQVVVHGDTKVEGNETFNVNLSGATNGATISHAQGVGTIVNDDVAPPPAPVVSIDNVSMAEGNNGTVIETFHVTRTGGEGAFNVNYTTADGTATVADGDYDKNASTLVFAQGEDSKTIQVVVHGDTKVEGNETFNVNLSGATNGATISHAQGVGTIVNDDTAPVTHHVADDFNGDGISDVLFGNNSGKLALWELNGNQISSNTTVGSIPAGWHLDGTGDFNGDGKSDILLHSDSGQVAMWQMNGDHVASNTTVGSIGSDWHVAEIADFGGDGKADILWENSKGQVAMWQMNGDHVASNTTVGSVGTDWHAIGAGDFNGDGKADVLWENSKGQVAMWEMNGDKIASNTTVGSVGTDWKAVGVGDFNGDGKADVLWENSKGQVAMWEMNGNHIASNTTVGSAPGWTVIGTGDYNHDGKADVLLQNASGHVAVWEMNGDHIAHNLTVGTHTTDWHMV